MRAAHAPSFARSALCELLPATTAALTFDDWLQRRAPALVTQAAGCSTSRRRRRMRAGGATDQLYSTPAVRPACGAWKTSRPASRTQVLLRDVGGPSSSASPPVWAPSSSLGSWPRHPDEEEGEDAADDGAGGGDWGEHKRGGWSRGRRVVRRLRGGTGTRMKKGPCAADDESRSKLPPSRSV